MVGEAIFLAICMAGVPFLLYVLAGFWRDDQKRHSHRVRPEERFPVVVELPPDPIFTAAAIRPKTIPEETPFTIGSSMNGSAAEFYVDGRDMPKPRKPGWRLLVNTEKPRLRKAR